MHQLKEYLSQFNKSNDVRKLRQPDVSTPNQANGYSVILARAFLLFVLTFDLFMNVYVLMSLDRNNLMVGLLTIATCAVGQFSAITGQFGYQIGDTLLKLFMVFGLILIVISVLLDQFVQNFMTKMSFGLTLLGVITGGFIMVMERRQQRPPQSSKRITSTMHV